MKENKNPEKPHYLHHRKRLKERFKKAPYAVTDSEILELLLGYVIKGRDIKPESKELAAKTKNLSKIFSVNIKDIKGLGDEAELFFSIIQEFYSRVNFNRTKEKTIEISSSGEVYDFLKYKIGYGRKENFALILLDSKNKVIDYKIIREGLVNTVPISARDIIEEAIKQNAVSVIAAHNHPSGDCTPSPADIDITQKIVHALKYTGITILDHIIVSSNDYYSMKANGYIS